MSNEDYLNMFISAKDIEGVCMQNSSNIIKLPSEKVM